MPDSLWPYESAVTATLESGPRLTVTDASDCAKLLIRTRRPAVGHNIPVPNGLPPMAKAERASDVLAAGTRPAEWTVIYPRGTDVSAVVPTEATTVDITHGRAAIRISGEAAGELLAQLCSIDFADDFTPNGAVVSGTVCDVMCDIIRDDGPSDVNNERSYLLLLDRSFAPWLSEQLVDVAHYLNAYPLKGQ